ncbi:MAG: hypothetical protein FWG07_03590 [Treponema sp.]|nr:hypothetical protein [Treponema sp.]
MAERDPRFATNGQVYISQVTNTDALLKNLSASGLCIESSGFMDVIPKTRYSVDIIPEKEANVDKFSLEIESRWVKAKMKSSESGFVIVIPPGTTGKTLLEQYIGYLASQQPDVEENVSNDIPQTSSSIDISVENQ